MQSGVLGSYLNTAHGWERQAPAGRALTSEAPACTLAVASVGVASPAASGIFLLGTV